MKLYIMRNQGSMTTTTVTITTTADGTTTITTSSSGSVSAGSNLSPEEISLIRDSWAIAKDIPAIQTRTLIE